MTTDPFTEAARTEAPPVCEHYWISHSQDSALIPWVIRCGSCGAFNTAEMDHLARAHLAAQEPSDAEVEAAAIMLCASAHHDRVWKALAEVDPWKQEQIRADARAALSSARAVGRNAR